MNEGDARDLLPQPASVPARAGADWEGMRGALVRAVARVCPRVLASQRDDIVQAALLRVIELQRRDEQHEIRSSSYLWRVAYTATIDELRRAGRRREVSLQDSELAAPAVTCAPDPEREAAAQQLGAAIRTCLSRLIRPRRLVVALHLYGFRAEESQRVLGWDTKRVRNLTYRGLADLRRCLEARGLRP